MLHCHEFREKVGSIGTKKKMEYCLQQLRYREAELMRKLQEVRDEIRQVEMDKLYRPSVGEQPLIVAEPIMDQDPHERTITVDIPFSQRIHGYKDRMISCLPLKTMDVYSAIQQQCSEPVLISDTLMYHVIEKYETEVKPKYEGNRMEFLNSPTFPMTFYVRLGDTRMVNAKDEEFPDVE
jgi:hypothetical protein